MIILKIIGICPVCEEEVLIDFSQPDTKIEPQGEEISLSFICAKCDEYIDQEILEKN